MEKVSKNAEEMFAEGMVLEAEYEWEDSRDMNTRNIRQDALDGKATDVQVVIRTISRICRRSMRGLIEMVKLSQLSRLRKGERESLENRSNRSITDFVHLHRTWTIWAWKSQRKREEEKRKSEERMTRLMMDNEALGVKWNEENRALRLRLGGRETKVCSLRASISAMEEDKEEYGASSLASLAEKQGDETPQTPGDLPPGRE